MSLNDLQRNIISKLQTMSFKNIKFIILSITIIIIAFAMGCEKQCYKYYQASFPINMYAKSDTINIGDTIFLKARFSRLIVNQAESGNFYLTDEFFYHNLNIVLLDRDSVDLMSIYSTGAYNSFDIFNKTGYFGEVYGNSLVKINYKTVNDSAIVDLQLIAKDTGVFVFMLVDQAAYRFGVLPISNKGNYTLGNSDCLEYYWHGLFINENTNNNYYLIKEHNAYIEDTTPYLTPDDRNKSSKDRQHDLEFGSFSVVVRE